MCFDCIESKSLIDYAKTQTNNGLKYSYNKTGDRIKQLKLENLKEVQPYNCNYVNLM